MRPANDGKTWNVFEKPENFGLLCAVPTEMPLPQFLISGSWRYLQRENDDTHWQTYLDTPIAAYGAHVNGFYLFMPTSIARHAQPRRASSV